MKVVGTGSPIMLTLRAKTCEVPLLREALRRRRGELVAAAAKSRAEPDDEPHDEMFVIAKLLDALAQPALVDQPREVVAPAAILDPAIRDAASDAVERLSDAVETFRADTGVLSADQLRAALDAVAACTTTLISLDYAQNHGVE